MKTKTNNMRFFKAIAVAIAGVFVIASCSREASNVTGWDYNNPKQGDFEKVPFVRD